MKSARFVLCAIAILFTLTIQSATAQTAHFSGLVSTLVSGYSPSAVAVDSFGNVFIADSSVGKVYELVAVNGQVSANSTVIAVSGFSKPSGVAVDANGNVFVGDTGHNAVKEIVATSGQISANSSVITVGKGFNAPGGVAVDASGDVFVADTGHSAIKEIVAFSGAVSTTSIVSAVGSGFNAPGGVALDSSGDVFVADTGNNAVKEIVASNGTVSSTSVVSAIGSGFTAPRSITLDLGGDVFVVDSGAPKEILSSSGSISSTSAVITVGSGYEAPSGVAVDFRGNVFVGDRGSLALDQIQLGAVDFGNVNVGSIGGIILIPFVFDSAGNLGGWAVYTQGATGLDFNEATLGTTCSETTDYSPGDTCSVAVSLSPKGAGWRIGAVQLLDTSGNVLASANLQGTGVGPLSVLANSTQGGHYAPRKQESFGEFVKPWGVAVDVSGNVFITEQLAYDVKEIMAVNGSVPASPTVRNLGGGFWFNQPESVAVDGSGNVFVGLMSSIVEIVAAGGYKTVKTLSNSFEGIGVAVDASGNLFFADRSKSSVYEIVAAGGYTTVKALGSGFSQPYGVAVDRNDDVFVVDLSNDDVKEILAAGGYTTIKTLASGLPEPDSIAVDAAGNVFTASNSEATVLEILAQGGYAIHKILDTGKHTLYSPGGVAVDGRGNVFVVDYVNDTLTQLDFADPPSLTFAQTPVGRISSDSPQTVTVSNNGNAPLTFPIPSIGENPAISSNFTWARSSTCLQTDAGSLTAFTLEAGRSCRVAIAFAPKTEVGAITGSAVLTDANLNAAAPKYATQSIPLSGTATEAPFGAAGNIEDATTFSTTIAQADNLVVTGWAADLFQGAPVTSVSILIDGTAVGNATLGVARPDVAAQYKGLYLHSGWTFTYPVSGLSVGTHTFQAVATDAQGASAELNPKAPTFAVSATPVEGPPFGTIGEAVDATTLKTTVSQADNLLVTGWAADPHDGAPVTQVQVLIDGTAVGNATLGIKRPDVAKKFGSAYLNSGWKFTYAASSLSLGSHVVQSVATDSLGNSTTLAYKAITVTK